MAVNRVENEGKHDRTPLSDRKGTVGRVCCGTTSRSGKMVSLGRRGHPRTGAKRPAQDSLQRPRNRVRGALRCVLSCLVVRWISFGGVKLIMDCLQSAALP